MIKLLSKNSCPSIPKLTQIDNIHHRTRRNVDSTEIDINAIQSTINDDHRIIIQYLFNNCINQSILADALYNHSRTAPSFTNWRDIVDMFCIGFLLLVFIYLLICRKGFFLCDEFIVLIFRPIFNRVQQKRDHQQREPTNISSRPTTVLEHLQSLSKTADAIHK